MRRKHIRLAMVLIARAAEKAKMETCSFRKMDGSAFPGNRDQYTEEIRRDTRLWRESYLIGPLEEAAKILEEELKR